VGGVGINGLFTFLMGLEGRDTLMPSSSIPGLISLPTSPWALTCFPTRIQQTLSLLRRENREQHSIRPDAQICADVRNPKLSIETTTLNSGQSHGKHAEKAIGK
jgi:hypothetical protein